MASSNPIKYKNYWVELNVLFSTTDVRITPPEQVQIDNMNTIHRYFRNIGWTHNAISGMLGNLMVESTVNPWVFQDRSIDWSNIQAILNTPGGMGLTQWTPARKYYTWAVAENKDPQDGRTMCDRIHYEQINNLQWSLENYGQHTWEDFITSNEEPYILADVWCWAYERPADPDMQQRWANAEWCAEHIYGGIPKAVLLLQGNKRKELKHRCQRI